MRFGWMSFCGLFVATVAVLGSGCGGATEPGEPESEPESEPETQPEAEPEGEAPTWTDAPDDDVTLDQGVWVELPLTVVDEDSAGEADVTATSNSIDIAIVDRSVWLHADYDTEGAQAFSVTLTDAESNRAVYDIGVSVRRLGWSERIEWGASSGPKWREHGTAIYDAASHASYVFGGTGYQPYAEEDMFDFWRFDIETQSWTEITPTGEGPELGASRRFAGVWGSGEGLLFGGYAGGTPGPTLDDLYRVRVENDTLHFDTLEQVNAPSARALHAFVYEAETDRYFLFGGVSQNTGIQMFNETWTMTLDGDVATWTQLNMGDAPSARYGTFYGQDESTGKLYVFSGAQFPVSNANQVNAAQDTWVLDMRADPPTWTQLQTRGEAPPGRRNGCFVFDPSGPRLVVHGGTPDAMVTSPHVWVLDVFHPEGEAPRWSRLGVNDSALTSMPLRSSGFGFYDGESTACGFGNNDSVYRDLLVLAPQ